MPDFLTAALQYVLVGDWFLAFLLGVPLMGCVIAFLFLCVQVVISLFAWPRYDVWRQRKLWHIAQYEDRAVPQTGDLLSQWLNFRSAWKKQSLLTRVQWMLEGVA